MHQYRYLVVGGGMTADSACRGIRSRDPDGPIGLLGDEPDPPYSRPPLSKALWQGKSEDTIWRGTAELGVDLRLGARVERVELATRTLLDERGERYGFDKLLLATGGRPRRLGGGAAAEVIHFRTLADYRRLRELVAPGVRIVVVGGGFIGSELAAALSSAGCTVTMVFPERGIGGRLFPSDLADSVNAAYVAHGVELRPGVSVEGVERGGEGLEVRLSGGEALACDGVVAGLGIEPQVGLAREAGLKVSDGIVVNEFGAAERSASVYAAGDVARFPAAVLGTQMRVEHEDNANSHGYAVGANMAGANEPYRHLPFFYSDLFELGYEAVGEVDSRARMEAEWVEPLKVGAVAYLDNEGRPRGFLLWNVFGKVEQATALIGAKAPLEPGALRALAE